MQPAAWMPRACDAVSRMAVADPHVLCWSGEDISSEGNMACNLSWKHEVLEGTCHSIGGRWHGTCHAPSPHLLPEGPGEKRHNVMTLSLAHLYAVTLAGANSVEQKQKSWPLAGALHQGGLAQRSSDVASRMAGVCSAGRSPRAESYKIYIIMREHVMQLVGCKHPVIFQFWRD